MNRPNEYSLLPLAAQCLAVSGNRFSPAFSFNWVDWKARQSKVLDFGKNKILRTFVNQRKIFDCKKTQVLFCPKENFDFSFLIIFSFFPFWQKISDSFKDGLVFVSSYTRIIFLLYSEAPGCVDEWSPLIRSHGLSSYAQFSFPGWVDHTARLVVVLRKLNN